MRNHTIGMSALPIGAAFVNCMLDSEGGNVQQIPPRLVNIAHILEGEHAVFFEDLFYYGGSHLILTYYYC